MSELLVERLAERAASSDGAPAVLRVRFDAPRRRNAINADTTRTLLKTLLDEPEAIVVLGSTTPGIFSAGADLTVDAATRARISDDLYACYELMITRPGPVLAVVEGSAVGGGAQLTTAADLRFASPAARWRWVGPGHGLAVGAWILPDLVGRSRALDLTLSARWVDADRALAIGLVSDVDDDPWSTALRVVDTLLAGDPAAVARVKQVATRPHLLAALAQERRRNREEWTGWAPTAREAAAEGRGSR